MSMIVTKRNEDSYLVTLDEPERTWVSLLSKVLQTPEYVVISIALDKGLIELMGLFHAQDKGELEHDNEGK